MDVWIDPGWSLFDYGGIGVESGGGAGTRPPLLANQRGRPPKLYLDLFLVFSVFTYLRKTT